LNRKEKDLLRIWACDFGVVLSGPQLRLLGIYFDELWLWNKRMNLTGLTTRERIIKELLLDSLIPSPFLPEKGHLLDVGSGAGFPAIPLKISRKKITFNLMEAKSKKVSFLRQVIRLLGLKGIEVTRGRIEKGKEILLPEGYNVITARALAHLPQTLTWCAPFLIPGGAIVNFQGSRFEHALTESSDVMKREQLFLYKSIPYTLPGKDSRRHVLIFKKNVTV
jgi:16S rRNA (guanine527-N7)-methyltransferase